MTSFMDLLASVAALALGACGWFAANVGGRSILTLRDARSHAISLSEQYAFSLQNNLLSKEALPEAERAFTEAAWNLKTLAITQPWPARLYCRVFGWDIRGAADAMFEVVHSSDIPGISLAIYVNLGAHRHFGRTAIDRAYEAMDLMRVAEEMRRETA